MVEKKKLHDIFTPSRTDRQVDIIDGPPPESIPLKVESGDKAVGPTGFSESVTVIKTPASGLSSGDKEPAEAQPA